MSKLVIRHALSEANNRDNLNDGKPAFGAPWASLMPDGEQQARELGQRLHDEYGLVVAKTPVATSNFKRAEDTAKLAGFVKRRTAAILGEVDHGLAPLKLRAMLDRNEFPPASHEAAEAVLNNPPHEPVWVAHGLLIAALCDVLGVKSERFIPRFCEVRKLPIR